VEESDAIVRPELVKISREFKLCSRTLKLVSGGVAGAEIQKYLYIFFLHLQPIDNVARDWKTAKSYKA
jgi:hypothetical protein